MSNPLNKTLPVRPLIGDPSPAFHPDSLQDIIDAYPNTAYGASARKQLDDGRALFVTSLKLYFAICFGLTLIAVVAATISLFFVQRKRRKFRERFWEGYWKKKVEDKEKAEEEQVGEGAKESEEGNRSSVATGILAAAIDGAEKGAAAAENGTVKRKKRVNPANGLEEIDWSDSDGEAEIAHLNMPLTPVAAVVKDPMAIAGTDPQNQKRSKQSTAKTNPAASPKTAALKVETPAGKQDLAIVSNTSVEKYKPPRDEIEGRTAYAKTRREHESSYHPPYAADWVKPSLSSPNNPAAQSSSNNCPVDKDGAAVFSLQAPCQENGGLECLIVTPTSEGNLPVYVPTAERFSGRERGDMEGQLQRALKAITDREDAEKREKKKWGSWARTWVV